MESKSKQPIQNKSKSKLSAVNSQKSMTSIDNLSNRILDNESMESKQSKASLKSVEKKVIFRMPIIIGSKDMPNEIGSHTIVYKTGEALT
jgi:hypothetical protein